MRLPGIQLFNLPMPPSWNRCFNFNHTTRKKFKSAEYQAFEKAMITWVTQNRVQIDNLHNYMSTYFKPGRGFKVDYAFLFPRVKLYLKTDSKITGKKKGEPQRIDVDNRFKTMNDSLAQVMGIDDCYFIRHEGQAFPIDRQGIEAHVTVIISMIELPKEPETLLL